MLLRYTTMEKLICGFGQFAVSRAVKSTSKLEDKMKDLLLHITAILY